MKLRGSTKKSQFKSFYKTVLSYLKFECNWHLSWLWMELFVTASIKDAAFIQKLLINTPQCALPILRAQGEEKWFIELSVQTMVLLKRSVRRGITYTVIRSRPDLVLTSWLKFWFWPDLVENRCTAPVCGMILLQIPKMRSKYVRFKALFSR